MGLGPLLLKTC